MPSNPSVLKNVFWPVQSPFTSGPAHFSDAGSCLPQPHWSLLNYHASSKSRDTKLFAGAWVFSSVFSHLYCVFAPSLCSFFPLCCISYNNLYSQVSADNPLPPNSLFLTFLPPSHHTTEPRLSSRLFQYALSLTLHLSNCFIIVAPLFLST